MTITRGKPVDATERRSGPQLTVGELFVAVRKHWLLVLGAFMGGIAIAVIVSNAQTRIFESVATIYFDPRPPQPLGEKVEPVVDTSADYWNRKEYYNTQHWILSSRAILEPVAERLRLRWDPGFIRNKAGLERENEPVLSLDEVVGILVSRIRVQPIDDSRLARITVRDASPERARRILTALTELYLSQNESELMAATTEASKWLHNQLTTLKSDLDESEIDLHKYKKEKDLLSVSLDDQSGMLREEISQINVALTEAKTRRQHIAARSQQLADVDEKDPVNLPARELLESVVLQQLRAHYLEVSKELSGLLGEGKGENHPSVVASKARRDASKTALLDEIRNIKRSLEKDVRAADSEIGGLQSLYNRARAGALEVNQLEIEYRKLRRTRDTNERLLTLVTERAKESDLARMLRVNNVRLIETPSMPRNPVSPNVPFNLFGGSMAGLLLGLAAAVGREALDRTIRSPEDAEASLGIPLIGVLPSSDASSGTYGRRARRRQVQQATSAIDFTAHDNPTSTFAEAARAIRTNIVFSSPDRPIRKLLVTSAGAGEGKTTVACNIAITMAQTGKRVLLVDCDLRRPRVHRIFKFENSAGLTGLLLDQSDDPSPFVRETHIPSLFVLPSGVIPPNPSELLHSQAFSDILRSLMDRFDLIVIDSPPLMPVTDGAVLAPQMDAVILVTRALITTRASAQRAVQLLQTVGANTLGTVLNALNPDHGKGGYYYRTYEYSRRDESTQST